MDSMKMQTRALPTKFRAVDDGAAKKIEGYFVVFNDVYSLIGGATESISHNAFDGESFDDIRALIDHESRLVLGRTKAGTLSLRVDDKGLWGSITLNQMDTDAMNLYARIARGDVDQCSFGFDILEETTSIKPNNEIHWTIERVKLYEVSCVTFPAYENTSIKARKTQFEIISRDLMNDWKSIMIRRVKCVKTIDTIKES